MSLCQQTSVPLTSNAQYLISRFHEDIVGDLPKREAQVNDIILCAASLREVTDVNNATQCRFPLGKLVGGEKSSQYNVFFHLDTRKKLLFLQKNEMLYSVYMLLRTNTPL